MQKHTIHLVTCYESGPSDSDLYLQADGPGRLLSGDGSGAGPRKLGDPIKIGPWDATKLVRFLRVRGADPIDVDGPDEAVEAVRDFVGCLEDVRTSSASATGC